MIKINHKFNAAHTMSAISCYIILRSTYIYSNQFVNYALFGKLNREKNLEIMELQVISEMSFGIKCAQTEIASFD